MQWKTGYQSLLTLCTRGPRLVSLNLIMSIKCVSLVQQEASESLVAISTEHAPSSKRTSRKSLVGPAIWDVIADRKDMARKQGRVSMWGKYENHRPLSTLSTRPRTRRPTANSAAGSATKLSARLLRRTRAVRFAASAKNAPDAFTALM